MTQRAQSLPGRPVPRVDGVLKVTGTARYSSDVDLPGLVHAATVQSTVAHGRIRGIDSAVALAASGVIAVITHDNAPRLNMWNFTESNQPSLAEPRGVPPLQTDVILHAGQHLAVAVADTLEHAQHAAELLEITYETQPALVDLDRELASAFRPPA